MSANLTRVHRIELPRLVLVGEDILPAVGDCCTDFGFEKALVVSGAKTYEVAGGRVIKILMDSGIYAEHSIVNRGDVEDVNEVINHISRLDAEVVVGVGGGKVIDVAKLASYRAQVPFISVPTSASHDGIASPMAVVKGLDKPHSIRAQTPLAIIADVNVISSAPRRFLASGCGDVIAKCVSVRDWKLAHKVKDEYYGEYAASLALMSAKLVMENVSLIRDGVSEGIRTLLEALISCGAAMCIAGSSRPCSGSEHMFSHALELLDPGIKCLHGERCGVGTIMMAYLHDLDWVEIRDKLKTVGAPTTAKELGVPPELVVKALTIAHKIRPERYTILGEGGLTKGAAERLAKVTGVI